MRSMRQRVLAGAAAIVAVVTVACADGPSAPNRALGPRDAFVEATKGGNKKGNSGNRGKDDTQTQSIDLTKFVDTLSRVAGTLLAERWVSPIGSPVYASATIDSAGGWVELAATGTYLYVPTGTVAVPTTFSIKAVAGKLAAFDFQPAGSVFKTPVFLVQDKTKLVNNPLVTGLLSTVGATQQLGYFADESKLDHTFATAVGSELRPSLLDSTHQYLAFPVYHFSGYIVSWGFRSRMASDEID